jgi:thiol-disulfide isomerase/thioredoxin
MKLSRRTAFTSLSLAILLVAGVFLINLRAAQEDEGAPGASTSAVTPVAAESAVEKQPSADAEAPTATTPAAAPVDPQFVVPDGSAAKKLAVLDKLTQPTTQFTSAAEANKYWRQAAGAMTTGGDQILAAKPTDDEASQAVQFKAEGLRILAMLGDKNADRQRTEFLDASLNDPRFEVASVVGPLRMLPKMRRWMQMDAAGRTAAIDSYIADVKAAGPTPGQVQLLVGLADDLSDSPNPLDTQLATRAVDELLPTFQKGLPGHKEPAVQDLLATLEGLSRRLHLPGGELELEGTLLDGKPLDWEAYRGKVVLVDFWASWCPECIKEVPNILDAYREYHDKGFEVIGVCLDNDRKLADQVIRQTGMTWPQVFADTPAGNGWAHPLQLKYAILGIPRAILVDQKGNVVTMLARGPLLDAQLQKLLGPANSAATSSSTNAATPQSESTSR